MSGMSHREKRDVWHQRIAAFYDSGLSASQFCAEHGLKPHQFWYWLRRLRNETVHHSQDTAFVSVVTISSPFQHLAHEDRFVVVVADTKLDADVHVSVLTLDYV